MVKPGTKYIPILAAAAASQRSIPGRVLKINARSVA
jgi:hypothetical protein